MSLSQGFDNHISGISQKKNLFSYILYTPYILFCLNYIGHYIDARIVFLPNVFISISPKKSELVGPYLT